MARSARSTPPWQTVAGLALAGLLARGAAAQQLRLLGDLNTAPGTPLYLSAGPTIGEGGEALAYFVLGDLINGPEVWRTDGTAAGTTILGEFVNTPFPNIFGVAGESIVFMSGPTLLAGSGAPGEFTVLLPTTGVTSRGTADFWLPHARLGPRLFLPATPPGTLPQLLVTDGTSAGTSALYTAPAASMSVASLGATPTRVFGAAGGSQNSARVLLVTDGVAPATVVHSFGLGQVDGGEFIAFGWITPAGETVYLIATDAAQRPQLWVSDGTDAGTTQLTAFTGQPWLSALAWNGVTGPGSRLAFLGPATISGFGPGTRLWLSDGTPAGTVLAGISNPVYDEPSSGRRPDTPRTPVVGLNGSFCFIVWESAGSSPPYGLRFGDGSVAGTAPLSTGTTTPLDFLGVSRGAGGGGGGDVACFIGAQAGWFSLWRTDGTQTGTFALPGPRSTLTSGIRPLAMLGRRLVYGVADTSPTNWTVWITDGTADGTHQLAGVGATPVGSASSSPGPMVAHLGEVVFGATGATTGIERCRATAAEGSAALCEESIPGGGPTIAPQFVEAVSGAGGGRLFSLAVRRIDVNGAPVDAPTLLVADDPAVLGDQLYSVTGTNRIFGLSALGELLLFTSQGEPGGDNTIWRSDGTPAGTAPIVPPGPSRPINPAGTPVEWNGRAYFIARATSGLALALWSTDGTDPGTQQVIAFSEGLSLNALTFQAFPDRLYFNARDSAGSNRLWVTDGVPAGAGTHIVDAGVTVELNTLPMAALGGTLLVAGSRAGSDADLWRPAPGDGSLEPAVTVRIGSATITWMTAVATSAGPRVFFVTGDGVHGGELWSTDGTDAGTAMVIDLWPGWLGSNPSNLVGAGAELVFTASTGPTGREVWATDGTEAGTRLLADINPGPGSSSPANLFYREGVVYLSAYRPDVGREPWSLTLAPCPADFNHDAALTSQDFFDFLAAFFAEGPGADFNHDSAINSQDFFDYLTAFLAGCA